MSDQNPTNNLFPRNFDKGAEANGTPTATRVENDTFVSKDPFTNDVSVVTDSTVIDDGRSDITVDSNTTVVSDGGVSVNSNTTVINDDASAPFNPIGYDYVSARDIDGDGTTDVVHTIDMLGVAENHYLDQNGDVILVEADMDGNGTFETSVRGARPGDGEIKEDLDDDGLVDSVRFFDLATNQTFQQDQVDHGVVTNSMNDIDGNGVTDFEMVDTNGDGRFDAVRVDSDQDGFTNAVFQDLDGDGAFDRVAMDMDGRDGVLETVVESSDYIDGDLGTVDDFSNLMEYPADDHIL